MNILVIDALNMCYRAFSATGHLSYNGIKTGVAFGCLRMIESLQKKYNTEKVYWCKEFGGKSHRQSFDINYKASRDASSSKEEKAEYFMQVDLTEDLLKKYGVTLLSGKNAEADDVAYYLGQSNKENNCLFVSTDQDWLINIKSDKHVVLVPGQGAKKETIWDEEKFIKAFGFLPEHTPIHKAIFGCESDEIPRIECDNHVSFFKCVIEGKDYVGKYDKSRYEINLMLTNPILLKNHEITYVYCDKNDNQVLDLYHKYGFNSFIKKYSADKLQQYNLWKQGN